jgi:hypothetical protein
LRDLLASNGKNEPMAEEMRIIKIDNIRKFWYLSPSAPKMAGAHGSSIDTEELSLIVRFCSRDFLWDYFLADVLRFYSWFLSTGYLLEKECKLAGQPLTLIPLWEKVGEEGGGQVKVS